MKPVPRIARVCEHCRETFHRTAAQLRADPARFCSERCHYAHNRTGQELSCVECGAMFYRKPSEPGKFCSPECAKASKRKNAHSYPKTGERHVHRVIAEQKLGRPLKKGEIAHHVDENKFNSAPNNIDVLPSQGEHARLHFTGRKQTPEQIRKRVEARAKTLRSKGRTQ